MGSALRCPCRKQFLQGLTKTSDAAGTACETVCAVSPRNRLRVWDTPGVSFPCGACDDLLFTNPLELASGLTDALLAAQNGSKDKSMSSNSAYSISAKILSSVCVGAAMSASSRLGKLDEVVYEKLQRVLEKPGKSDPLVELQRATLLHAKFLLELCFGCCSTSVPLPGAVTRLAVRLFGALHAAEPFVIWNILEDIRCCKLKNWQHRDTAEGKRFQVACAVLQIYALTFLLTCPARVLESFDSTVCAALEEISTALSLSATASNQVGAYHLSYSLSSHLLEQGDLTTEVHWLTCWMVLHAAGTLFTLKPCNASQTKCQAWAVKQASELSLWQAGSPASSAVSLRAVSLLIMWRKKLEEIFEEDLLVAVNVALSASSGHSTLQGTPWCESVMVLLQTPSLILAPERSPCWMHMGLNNVVFVPGMSAEEQPRAPSEDGCTPQAGEGGLSPDQLPLVFSAREDWSSLEGQEDSGLSLPPAICSWKLQALEKDSRPEAMFSVHADTILEGEDILMATMTLTAAKVRCTNLPNCMGFHCKDIVAGEWSDREVDVHFKAAWNPRQSSSGQGVAYQKERASPLFTRYFGYNLAGPALLVSEMTVEAAKRACLDLQDCMGFTFEGNPADGAALVRFKSGTKLLLDATGTQTSYCFQAESRSFALPADGAAFCDLLADHSASGFVGGEATISFSQEPQDRPDDTISDKRYPSREDDTEVCAANTRTTLAEAAQAAAEGLRLGRAPSPPQEPPTPPAAPPEPEAEPEADWSKAGPDCTRSPKSPEAGTASDSPPSPTSAFEGAVD